MIGLNVSLLDKLDSTDKDPIASAASNNCSEFDNDFMANAVEYCVPLTKLIPSFWRSFRGLIFNLLRTFFEVTTFLPRIIFPSPINELAH